MHRKATILIMSVFLITYAVIIATTFVNTMTEYRNTGTQNARTLLSDIAIQQGKAHAIRVLQEHAIDDDPDSPDFYSCFASSWRTDFQIDVTLEPGGIWPTREFPKMNVPEAGVTVQGIPYGHSDNHKFNNSMVQPFNNRFNTGYASGWEGDGRIWTSRHGARYFRVGQFDRNYMETTDPKKARYELRYAVIMFDVNGMNAVNFYPEREYSTDELDEDLDADGNPGDRRREFAYLRDRYTAAAFAKHTGNKFFKRRGLYDPYESAYDYHLRGLLSQTEKTGGSDGQAWFRDSVGASHRIFVPLAKEWQDTIGIKNGWSVDFDSQYGVTMLSALQPSGVQWRRPGYLRFKHPGPTYTFDANSYVLPTGANGLQNNQRRNILTPFGEQLSRRRGDDVDSPYYYNILTTHNADLYKILSTPISEMLLSKTGSENNPSILNTPDFGKPSTTPLDLLPYTRGLPFEVDDNYDRSTYSWDPEYFDIQGDQVTCIDHDGDSRTSPIPDLQYKRNAWYEFTREMKRQFYGLKGDEGKAIGPRLTPPGNISAYNGHILFPDYPGYPTAAIEPFVQEHYAFDVLDALSMAINGARKAWSGTSRPGRATDMSRWDARKDLRDRWYRDIHAVHRRFLNNLGEDIGVNAAAPSAAQLRPENWRAGNGLLAGYTLKRDLAATASDEPGDNNWLLARSGSYDDPTVCQEINDHPEVHRLPAGTNTAGMERLLNDVRMSFFGSQYIDEFGAVQPIPALDFNHDGFAESSYNGFNDGSIPRPSTAEYATNGPRPWRHIATDTANPYHPFLAKKDYFPDRPFTTTGRLYMGKSHYYRIIVRGQLWDLERNKKSAEQNSDFIYVVNPSDKAGTILIEGNKVGSNHDLSDSHIIFQRTLVNNTYDGQTGLGQ